jgi:hypothetical protein
MRSPLDRRVLPLLGDRLIIMVGPPRVRRIID